MYCHKCGEPDQHSDSFCRRCGNYLPDVDKLARKYGKENSPETRINKNLAANVFNFLLSIFAVFSVAFIFAGELWSVIFVHLAVLFSFMIGGWQLLNLKNNLKLRKLIKEKKLGSKSKRPFGELNGENFSGITISEIIARNTSGSLKLDDDRFRS